MPQKYIPAKPPDLDDNGNPVQTGQRPEKPPDLDDYGNPVTEEQSFGSQVWHSLVDPTTDFFERTAKKISPYLDRPEVGAGVLQSMDVMGPVIRQLRGKRANAEVGGFLAGSLEGAGQQADVQLTSPLGAATTALGPLSNLATRGASAVPKLAEVASGLSKAQKIASIPFAGHGALTMGEAGMDLMDPEKSMYDVAQKGFQGLTSFAGGVLGARHVPTAHGPVMSWLDREYPTQMESVLGKRPAKPTVAPTPGKSNIPENIAAPEEVIVKKGKTAADEVLQYTKAGFVLSGSTKEGHFVLTKPPEAGPTVESAAPKPSKFGSRTRFTLDPKAGGFQKAHADLTAEGFVPRPGPSGTIIYESPKIAGKGLPTPPATKPSETIPETPTAPVSPQGQLPFDVVPPDAEQGNLPFGGSEPTATQPNLPFNREPTIGGQQEFRFGDPDQFTFAQPSRNPLKTGLHEFQPDQPFELAPPETLPQQPPMDIYEQLARARMNPNIGGGPVSNRMMGPPREAPVTPEVPQQYYGGHEFQPDMTPGREVGPGGGISPTFETPAELPPAPPSFMDRVRRFMGDESGESDIGPEGEKGPIERSLFDWGPNSEPDYMGRLPEDAVQRTPGGQEVYPPEVENDIFGIPKNRDLTPEEVAHWKRQMDQHLMESYGADTAEGQAAVDEMNGIIDMPTEEWTGEEPAFSQVKPGRAKIDVNVKHAAKELTTGYNEELPAIMSREGLQNGFDAVKHMPGASGRVAVRLREAGSANNPGSLPQLEIEDNGRGMSPDELYTVYTNLHESGKANDPNATGGKGVGKATYMLGGSHFEVTTVKDINGQKVQSSFSGTPEELMEGFDIESQFVPPETPTGTKFITTFEQGQEIRDARIMVNKINKYSRGLQNELHTDMYGFGHDTLEQWKSPADDTQIIDDVVGNGSSGVKISIPKDAKFSERQYIDVHYLNNGMYQFSKTHFISEPTKGIPDNALVNLEPRVKEGSEEYPFPVQRESIKDTYHKEIEKIINDRLVHPLAEGKKADLVKLWGQMPIVRQKGIHAGNRDVVFFDPGDRLTPQEKGAFLNSSPVNDMLDHIDDMVDNILRTSGRQEWRDKVVRVGITLDPTMHGVHIPNPAAKGTESAIFINPFLGIAEGRTPQVHAMDLVITGIHEAAHVGTDSPASLKPFDSQDLSDPRVGQYLQAYIKETIEQGGLNPAHGMPFIKRLGNLFSTYGTQNALDAATHIESILTGGRPSGGYSPEVQKLLRVYEESRGRPAVTEDILSATGVKQANTGRTGEGNISGATGTDEGGIWVRNPGDMNQIHAAIQQGYEFSGEVGPDGAWKFNKSGTGQRTVPPLESEVGSHRPTTKNVRQQLGTVPSKEPNMAVQIMNAPRTIMASGDLSGALRQGVGLIHKSAYWKALPEMFKAWASEEGFNASQARIAQRPLFKQRVDARGNVYKSFAEDAGVKLTDIVNNREEAFMSKLVDKYPLVRRSNRAYTAFLNNLRASAFESLVMDHGVFTGEKGANLHVARELAEFVNTASGRGSMGALESSAANLSTVLFSPRLIASRLQMMTKGAGAVFSPETYIFSKPSVRREYIKSLLALATMGNVVTQMGKYAGQAMGFDTEVSMDPSSSDFGKLRIGNTRIDPYAGFQQYIVAANRLLNPVGPATGFEGDTPFSRGQMVTSTRSGNEYDLQDPQKPFDPTWLSTLGRIGWSKTNPVINFAISLGNARKNMEGKTMNFTSMNPMENSVMQMFVPLVMQDIYDIAKDDPRLLPLGALGISGMGMQTYGSDDFDEEEEQ